jgi:hypothetical protein
MALNDPNIVSRGATSFPHLQYGGLRTTCASAISPFRLMSMDSTGKYAQSAVGDTAVVGVNGELAKSAGDTASPHRGATVGYSDDVLTPGWHFKAGDSGRIIRFLDAAGSGAAMLTTGNGIGFTNQPLNDSSQAVSSNAGDTTQTITWIGTTTGTNTVVSETKALNGTTAITSTKTDWGQILAIKLSASCAGTVTVKKTTGALAITTLATTVLTKGVELVLAANQQAYNVAPTLVGSGSSTKQVGLAGTNSAGTAIFDSKALNGTTAVTMNATFKRVTEVYTGDLETNRTVTLSTGAADVAEKRLGIVGTATTAQGQLAAVQFRG